MTSRKRCLSAIDSDNNDSQPSLKRRKPSLITLSKQKIKEILDLENIEYCLIDQLSQSFEQISDEYKNQILNSLYKRVYNMDIYREDDPYYDPISLMEYIIHESHPMNKTQKSKLRQIVKIFVEHGMSLMANKSGLYQSYLSLDFNAGFDMDEFIILINTFQQHPFHCNYFAQHDQLALITLSDHNTMHIYGHAFSINGITPHKIRKLMQSSLSFDFIRFVDTISSLKEQYNHKQALKWEISDINAQIAYFSEFINPSYIYSLFQHRKDIIFLFVITEMMQQHSTEIFNMMMNALDFPQDITTIISQYTLTEIPPLFTNKYIKYKDWIIQCFESLRIFANDGQCRIDCSSSIYQHVQEWFNLFAQYIESNNEYRNILCDYIMSLSVEKFINLSCYPFIAKLMFKIFCIQHEFVSILKNLDYKYVNYGNWWGKLIVIVMKNCSLNHEQVVKIICDTILPHLCFKPNNNIQVKQVLDAFNDESKKKNISNIEQLASQISAHLCPSKATGWERRMRPDHISYSFKWHFPRK